MRNKISIALKFKNITCFDKNKVLLLHTYIYLYHSDEQHTTLPDARIFNFLQIISTFVKLIEYGHKYSLTTMYPRIMLSV